MDKNEVMRKFDSLCYDQILADFAPMGLGDPIHFEDKLLIVHGVNDIHTVLDYDALTHDIDPELHRQLSDLLDQMAALVRSKEENFDEKMMRVLKYIDMMDEHLSKKEICDYTYLAMTKPFRSFLNAMTGWYQN